MGDRIYMRVSPETGHTPEAKPPKFSGEGKTVRGVPITETDKTLLPKGFGIAKIDDPKSVSLLQWHENATHLETHFEHASKAGVAKSAAKDLALVALGVAAAVLIPGFGIFIALAALGGVAARHMAGEKAFRNRQFANFDPDKLSEFVKVNSPEDFSNFTTARNASNVDMQLEILEKIEARLKENGEKINTLDFYPDSKYAGQAAVGAPTPEKFAPGPKQPPVVLPTLANTVPGPLVEDDEV